MANLLPSTWLDNWSSFKSLTWIFGKCDEFERSTAWQNYNIAFQEMMCKNKFIFAL